MNFLMLRSNSRATNQDENSVEESEMDRHYSPRKGAMFQGPISQDKTNDDCRDLDNSSYSRVDISEDDGLIIIPYKQIPDNWSEAPDILSYRSLDRDFVLAGEQVRVLACLFKPPPFKVALDADSEDHHKKSNQNDQVVTKDNRNEDQLLQMFKDSHFFARIAESNEPLWSKRRSHEKSSEDSSESRAKKKKCNSAAIDRGEFDATKCGGLVRGGLNCCTLSNGDIVVLLQVNMEFESMEDPILEIVQFHETNTMTIENEDMVLMPDPFRDLLKWLLPLNNNSSSNNNNPRPPIRSSSSSIRAPSSPSSSSSSSVSSQLFPFGHFRSYSMSSLSPDITTSDAKSGLDSSQFSFRKFPESGNEKLLSFRGVELEPERFSVQFGLEGVFAPGRSWRRRVELIQPVQIQSFSAHCNSNNLLCVHVKNVSPANRADIVVYVDSIAIVLEEASSRRGSPLASPVVCTEAGNEYSLPNVAIRRGEQHSFILRPATTLKNNSSSTTPADRYALLVSCRCNYTESKLFYKQPTSWRPRDPMDLMISVGSETSRPMLISDRTRLPIQALTLEASNMTCDDLSLTVVAPISLDHCTHSWLRSRIPLGCVAAQSTVTTKIEIFPLIDGIITLDSLRIDVKEKDVAYIPEHAPMFVANVIYDYAKQTF